MSFILAYRKISLYSENSLSGTLDRSLQIALLKKGLRFILSPPSSRSTNDRTLYPSFCSLFWPVVLSFGTIGEEDHEQVQARVLSLTIKDLIKKELLALTFPIAP